MTFSLTSGEDYRERSQGVPQAREGMRLSAAAATPRPALRGNRTFRRLRFSPAAAAAGSHGELTPAFQIFLTRVLRRGDAVADLGSGEGRAVFAAAGPAGRIVGLDRDPTALRRARARARALGLGRARFVRIDLEGRITARELRRRLAGPQGFDVVLAHLCVSDRILKRAAALLRPGGWAVVTALHADHWYETGRGSRFSYAERDLLRSLAAARLVPAGLEIHTTEITFPSIQVLRDRFLGGARSERLRRWRQDGRWAVLAGRFRAGRRTLTESTITALARRASSQRRP